MWPRELGADGGRRQMRVVRVVSGWCQNGVGVMLNGLSLFSGIGGLDVALSDYVRPIAYCEIDAYCQGVLFNQMEKGFLLRAPIWGDIRSLDGSDDFRSCVDIIYGGFPCQDISVAGHGKGLAGERSGLYWQIHRLAKEIIPKFIFLENVPAICTKGGWDIVSSLAEVGYNSRWCVMSAASVGACHKRERWFCLAKHADGDRRDERKEQAIQGNKQIAESAGICPNVADTESSRLQGQWPISCGLGASQPQLASNCNDGDNNSVSSKQTNPSAIAEQNDGHAWRGHTGQYWPFESRADWQETVSRVRRVSDGVPNRVDRIKCLGNAVVPAQGKKAFETLMGLR
jgi:DNA (cytosine-5)-methyltransferase 1